MYEEATTKHLNDYGEAGLRTLALAYRKLEESEYTAWNDEFVKAKTSIGGDREAMLERVSDMVERDLILIGATAVEDKLQQGVSTYNAIILKLKKLLFLRVTVDIWASLPSTRLIPWVPEDNNQENSLNSHFPSGPEET